MTMANRTLIVVYAIIGIGILTLHVLISLGTDTCAALPDAGREVTYYERPGNLDGITTPDGTLAVTLNGFPCRCESAKPGQENGTLVVEYACPWQGTRFAVIADAFSPAESYVGNGTVLMPLDFRPVETIPQRARMVLYDEDLRHLFGDAARARAKLREVMCDAEGAPVRNGTVRKVVYSCPDVESTFAGIWQDGDPAFQFPVPVFLSNGSEIIGPLPPRGAWWPTPT